MKIFEFSFNPKADGDRVRKLLHKQERVFLLGEIERPLPRDRKLLDEIFETAEGAYHPRFSTSKAQVKSALKKTNQFLARQQQQGNIDWLGHLHCFLLFLDPTRKKSVPLYAAGLGNIRMFLVRNKRLTEIQKIDTKAQMVAPHAFGSMISGTLIPGDKLFLFTKDLAQALLKEKMLQQSMLFEKETNFQNFFKGKRSHFAKSSGLLTVIIIPALANGAAATPAILRRKLSLSLPSSLLSLHLNITKNQLLILLFLLLLGVGFVLFRLL